MDVWDNDRAFFYGHRSTIRAKIQEGPTSFGSVALRAKASRWKVEFGLQSRGVCPNQIAFEPLELWLAFQFDSQSSLGCHLEL